MTEVNINDKLDVAIQSVYAPEDVTPSELAAYANKQSVGQIEGYEAYRKQWHNVCQKHHESHTMHQQRMQQYTSSQDHRKWERILSSTGATREKIGNVALLAERDVKIVNGELRGKYTFDKKNGRQQRGSSIGENDSI